jgi:hypothetical protein
VGERKLTVVLGVASIFLQGWALGAEAVMAPSGASGNQEIRPPKFFWALTRRALHCTETGQVCTDFY